MITWPSWKTTGTVPYRIAVRNVGSGAEQEIVANAGGEYGPKFSPDATRLAWTSLRNSSSGDVYVATLADVSGTLVTNRHLLAELVVRSTNQWERLDGVKTVSS